MSPPTAPDASNVTDTVSVLTFRSEKNLYALPLQSVQRVLHAVAFTPLADVSAEIAGAINLHGEYVPVIDARARLSLTGADLTPSDNLILMTTPTTHVNGEQIPWSCWVLWVDQVIDLKTLMAADISAFGTDDGSKAGLKRIKFQENADNRDQQEVTLTLVEDPTKVLFTSDLPELKRAILRLQDTASKKQEQ